MGKYDEIELLVIAIVGAAIGAVIVSVCLTLFYESKIISERNFIVKETSTYKCHLTNKLIEE